MVMDIEEQQQVEEVKKWLVENVPSLIITILIVAILLFAYQRWNQMRERAMDHASYRYEQLLDDLAANKTDEANHAAAYLIKRYPHSTYAKLAEILLAKRDVDQQKYADAESKLTDVMEHANVSAVKEIARLRLARLQVQLQHPEEALNTLKDIDAKEYLPAANAVKGDAYTLMNKPDMAKVSYQQAVAGLPEGAILRSIVSMKLNNLPN